MGEVAGKWYLTDVSDEEWEFVLPPERAVDLASAHGAREKVLEQRERENCSQVGPPIPGSRAGLPSGTAPRAPPLCRARLRRPWSSRRSRLRRLRWTCLRIAAQLGLSTATVSRILRRAGLHRLDALDPPPPVVRYEHPRPGDLIHFDIKRLARIVRPGPRPQ